MEEKVVAAQPQPYPQKCHFSRFGRLRFSQKIVELWIYFDVLSKKF